MSVAKTYAVSMQEIADEFFAETGNWQATSKEIAVWAIRKKLWKPPQQMAVKICSRDVSRALREEYVKDSHGRSVRAKHVARKGTGEEQQVFWADIRNAPREHMELAFQQRRRQIVGDCHQLKVDVDFYNESNSDKKPILLIFDFSEDLEEIEAVEMLESNGFRPPKKG